MAGRIEEQYQAEKAQEAKIKDAVDAMQPDTKVEAVMKATENLGSAVVEVASVVGEKVAEAATAAKDKVVEVGSSAKDAVVEAGSKAKDKVTAVGTTTKDAVVDAGSKAKRKSVELAGKVLDKAAAGLHTGAAKLTPEQAASSATEPQDETEAKIQASLDKLVPEPTQLDKVGDAVKHGVAAVTEATGVLLEKGSETLAGAAKSLKSDEAEEK